MKADSIRVAANQFGDGAELITVDAAIDFVKARTTATGRRTQEQADRAKVVLEDLMGMVKKEVENTPTETETPVTNNNVRRNCLIVALVIPTLASITNTLYVSHALSNNLATGILITGVASATSLLFLWAGVQGVGAWLIVAATLGFEAFCNACSVFKALMGSMAYSITTVSGKPSEFLDMVSNFTGRDHQDAATWMAIFTAAMICGAQVTAIYELKK